MADSPWPTIHAERGALADDLATLSDTQWSTPSLCPAWSVQEVLAHMTATAEMNPAKFVAKLAGSGFAFNAMAAKDVATRTAGTPADTLAGFRGRVNSSSHPPGPVLSWLGETVVHAEDIRRPLGITHTYPTDAVRRLCEFFSGSNVLIGSKKRIGGLTLRATDTEWSTGSGPEVSGPALSLLMAMTGRPSALDELSGPGLDTLRARS